jgi:predicted homoserine dehydrogenase-like protein
MPSYIAPSGTTYMLVFNPQHLLGVEAPLSILSAVRLGRPTGAVCPTPCTDLVAVASRDLRAGETLSLNQASHGVDALEPRLLAPQRMTLTADEASGGTAARESACVPYYLAAGAVMTRDVCQGERLALADVAVPRGTALFRLRVQQEALTAEDWMMETRRAVANSPTMEETVELAAVSRL